jgi:hypothetical protein
MIPLARKTFPSSKADLAQALDEALRRYASKEGPIVEVHARVFPYIDEVAINFDGAQLQLPPPQPPKLTGETTPAFEAAVVSLSARQISIRGLPFNLQFGARDVVFHKAQDENENAVIVVHNVRDGTLTISAAQLDLERAIEQIAKEEGCGLTIEQVRLSVRARGQRSLALELQVQAKKLFLRVRIDISTQIDIDDNFTIKISNSKCKGEGSIGSIACSTLEPMFRKLEAKSFSLKSLPLGDVHVRDIRLAVADTIELTADFGSSAK